MAHERGPQSLLLLVVYSMNDRVEVVGLTKNGCHAPLRSWLVRLTLMNAYHKGTNSQSSHPCLSHLPLCGHSMETPSLAHPHSPHKQAHLIKQSQEALHILTKPTYHITSHRITAQDITSHHSTAQDITSHHRQLQVTGVLPAHTTHNSLLLTLENVTEYSVGRGCKRFGVLALMLQPVAPPRHVNYHETTALSTVHMYTAGVQMDLSTLATHLPFIVLCRHTYFAHQSVCTWYMSHNSSTHSTIPTYVPHC